MESNPPELRSILNDNFLQHLSLSTTAEFTIFVQKFRDHDLVFPVTVPLLNSNDHDGPKVWKRLDEEITKAIIERRLPHLPEPDKTMHGESTLSTAPRSLHETLWDFVECVVSIKRASKAQHYKLSPKRPVLDAIQFEIPNLMKKFGIHNPFREDAQHEMEKMLIIGQLSFLVSQLHIEFTLRL
jgi:hypothetical protein